MSLLRFPIVASGAPAPGFGAQALLLSGKVAIGEGVRYAYGFFDRVVGGRRFVGHSGGAPATNGDLAFEPNGGYVIVVLSNLDPPAAGRVASFILGRLPAVTEERQ